MDLWIIADKGHSAFPKSSGMEPHYHIVYYHTHDIRCMGSCTSAEMQFVNTSAPSNNAIIMAL